MFLVISPGWVIDINNKKLSTGVNKEKMTHSRTTLK